MNFKIFDIQKLFKKEKTRFGLTIGQKKSGIKWVSWYLISNYDQSVRYLGKGDLSLTDLERISREIKEGEMFVFGYYNKKIKAFSTNAILYMFSFDETQGIVKKDEIFQVSSNKGITKYPLDSERTRCENGEIEKEQMETIEITNIAICDVVKMILEFINVR